jgi:beta-glucanase (GH16 family)
LGRRLFLAPVAAAALLVGLTVDGADRAVPAPAIRLPRGFAPVAHYRNIVRNYGFGGSALPADWSVGTGNHGFPAMTFVRSHVTMTGAAVALEATSPSAGASTHSGGWISTAGHFSLTHGLIDFRARMPAGQGLWSGLWAANAKGSTPQGEIDVQEMLLSDPRTVYGSLHDWDQPIWEVSHHTRLDIAATSGYHDYQVVWQPGMITWAVDGVAYAQYTRAEARAAGRSWPFDNIRGIYLIADLAVGATGGWAGPPSAHTAFPATMEVQSVRVWQ